MPTASKLLLLALPAALILAPARPGAHAADPFTHLDGTASDPALERRTFRTTQEWNREYRKHVDGEPRFIADWEKHIVLPRPPANSSARTRAELDNLKTLQDKRTPGMVEEIKGEIKIEGFRLGPHSYPAISNPKENPHTHRLIDAANHDLQIITFSMKARFDRVRPRFLDTDLMPCIAIPKHPAYPSGHATQAHVLAYIFQELDPDGAAAYRYDALRIARNREIAGVHYPSDSWAGILLARQIADRLFANPEFQVLLEKARAEWMSGPRAR